MLPALPYALPSPGTPVRVAFVGQRTYVETALPAGPCGDLVPRFVDFRSGGDIAPVLDELRAFRPHAVVCFRPDTVPAGAFAEVPAPVVGFTIEPLPRFARPSHPNLDYNLAELRKADPANVDRVIVGDALGFEAVAAFLPAWRSMPLPVADDLYRAPRPAGRPPRLAFVGPSTAYREEALIGLKHRFDLPHYAHALLGENLRDVLEATDVALALRHERWLVAFEHHVLVHLAAGHLLVSEPLDPKYGLDPGIHYVEVEDRYELDLRVHQVMAQPDAYDRVRIRGHQFSRQFRASAVWPRVIADLFADLAAFGTERAIAAAA